MELFLLFGDDYVEQGEIGKKCHESRVAFEEAFMPDRVGILWDFYDSLASRGFGRELIYICRKGRYPINWDSFSISEGRYNLTSIDSSHIEEIRKWRNQQIDVLRQEVEISEDQQLMWHKQTVMPSMNISEPEFILFGYRVGERLIGYGGLTNIKWGQKRAEVSFLLSTERTEDTEKYSEEMAIFLEFMKRIATSIGITRLVSETYDTRDHHISVLENSDFVLEGRLKKHARKSGRFVDCLCHAWVSPKH